MDELEHKISELLSNPEGMEQLMSLARSLSGGGEKAAAADPPSSEPPPLGGAFDPAMMSKVIGMLGKLNEQDSGKKNALIAALKPYLSEARRDKVDRALSLMRMTKLARAALTESEGGKEGV